MDTLVYLNYRIILKTVKTGPYRKRNYNGDSRYL